jgi:hypothetical protein
MCLFINLIKMDWWQSHTMPVSRRKLCARLRETIGLPFQGLKNTISTGTERQIPIWPPIYYDISPLTASREAILCSVLPCVKRSS